MGLLRKGSFHDVPDLPETSFGRSGTIKVAARKILTYQSFLRAIRKHGKYYTGVNRCRDGSQYWFYVALWLWLPCPMRFGPRPNC